MKRFLIITAFILALLPVVASAMPSLKLNGNKFTLYYSAKSPEAGSYINEYYKNGENYENWSELVAVHHFPTAYSPIDYAKNMNDYLSSMNCPCSIVNDEENNQALIDFILIDSSKLPIILEFNIFRYEKSPVCGSVALQYAKRYLIYNILEVDKVKKSLEKDRSKYLNKVKKLDMPDIVTYDIERGKYKQNEGIVPQGNKVLD